MNAPPGIFYLPRRAFRLWRLVLALESEDPHGVRSLPMMAGRMRVSERTVERAARDLIEAGYAQAPGGSLAEIRLVTPTRVKRRQSRSGGDVCGPGVPKLPA